MYKNYRVTVKNVGDIADADNHVDAVDGPSKNATSTPTPIVVRKPMNCQSFWLWSNGTEKPKSVLPPPPPPPSPFFGDDTDTDTDDDDDDVIERDENGCILPKNRRIESRRAAVAVAAIERSLGIRNGFPPYAVAAASAATATTPTTPTITTTTAPTTPATPRKRDGSCLTPNVRRNLNKLFDWRKDENDN